MLVKAPLFVDWLIIPALMSTSNTAAACLITGVVLCFTGFFVEIVKPVETTS